MTVFTTLLFAGCQPAEPETGALELSTHMHWQEQDLMIESGIRFEPTEAMREALEHGIDLELDVTTRISQRFGPIARLHESRTTQFRIRYQPLIEFWQLERTGADGQTVSRSYPRFWLLTEALTERLDYDTGLSRSMLENARWQVQIRAELDRGALPGPMQLPTLFAPEWRLGGRWHTWQFDGS